MTENMLASKSMDLAADILKLTDKIQGHSSLKNQLESEINTRDNELKYLKEQTISREEYLKLQGELNRKNDKIKRLEEINTFFNELQEEQEAFDTVEKTPPFRLEKKQKRR